jgi:hypothetical protein
VDLSQGLLARRLAIVGLAGSLAAAAFLVFSPAAGASTTVGATVASPQPCAGGYDTVQLSSTGASYAVPAGGGPLTDWSIQAAGLGTGPVALEVWRPSGGTYTLVAVSPSATLSGTNINTFTLASPIATQQGDLLGLRVIGSTPCGQSTTSAGDVYGWVHNNATTVGGSVAMSQTLNFGLNVAATLGVAAPPTPTATPTATPSSTPSSTPTAKPTPTTKPTPTPSTNPGSGGTSWDPDEDNENHVSQHNRRAHHHRPYHWAEPKDK